MPIQIILHTLIARAKFISQKNNKCISQHENLYVRETLANVLYLPLAAQRLLVVTSYALSCLKMTIKQFLIMKN